MGQVLALSELLSSRTVWRGQPAALPVSSAPTQLAQLDQALPLGGWPEAALTEILLPVDGVGELELVLPTLARLTQHGKPVVMVEPPYIPYAPALQSAGVDLRHLHIVDAEPKKALWAFEQCLRSGVCAAVLGWPRKIDHHGLRRLQVAADTGRTLGFAFRDAQHVEQASPAALRLEITGDRAVRVRKCRGGPAPARVFPLPVNY
jgi:cell division inhibitor SulA